MGKNVRDPARRVALKQVFAAKMRQTPTDAERRLWSVLRSKQVGGLRFRRQQPIGPYIVDFFCPAAKLIVELDGDQHGSDKSMTYDEARTRWLASRGYRVLRFSNEDVFKDHRKIVDAVTHVFEDHGIPLAETRVASSDPPSRAG